MPIRSIRFVTLFLAALALSACGPSEPDQRQAFVGFLQDDVLAKKGVRVPALTEEKRKAFGPYAAGYDVITRFHQTMNAEIAKPMQETLAKTAPGSIQSILERKTEIATVRAGLAKLRDALDQAAAAAEKERAALNLPPDLAGVYGAAFDKLVTKPAAAFREVFPVADDAFGSVLSFAGLIEGARSKIKLDGSSMEIADKALRDKVQAAMTALNDRRAAINAAQDKVRRLVYGD